MGIYSYYLWFWSVTPTIKTVPFTHWVSNYSLAELETNDDWA